MDEKRGQISLQAILLILAVAVGVFVLILVGKSAGWFSNGFGWIDSWSKWG
jgi:hypothetical protein